MIEGTSALTMNPPLTRPYGLTRARPAPSRPALPARPRQEVRSRPETAAPSKRVETAVNPAMRLSFRPVALFACAMTLLLFIVYSYMQLSQIGGANQRAASEIAALKKAESVLNRQVEAGVSLHEVEAYAIGELGMVKPTREQVVYIRVPAEDHGEVIKQEGFWGNVRQLFSTMGVRVTEFFD